MSILKATEARANLYNLIDETTDSRVIPLLLIRPWTKDNVVLCPLIFPYFRIITLRVTRQSATGFHRIRSSLSMNSDILSHQSGFLQTTPRGLALTFH